MANFVYNEQAFQAASAGINLGTVETRAILVMSNTNADTSRTAQTVAGITTLDEFNGAGYTSGGIIIANPAVTREPGSNGSKFDGDDITWTALSPGARQIQAALVIQWVTNLNNSIPLAYYDTSGFPFTPNGGDVTINWSADGIITFRSAALAMTIPQTEHRAVSENEVHQFAVDFQTMVLYPGETLISGTAVELDTSDLLFDFVGPNATPLSVNGNAVDIGGAVVGQIKGQLYANGPYRVLITATTSQQQVYERELHIAVI